MILNMNREAGNILCPSLLIFWIPTEIFFIWSGNTPSMSQMKNGCHPAGKLSFPEIAYDVLWNSGYWTFTVLTFI
jgi:hypothetical protein